MAYGTSYYRRRLGGKLGNYASTMGLQPVPFTRKRKGPPTITGTQVPIRLGRRVRARTAGSTFTATKRKRQRFGTAKKTGDNSSISATRFGRAWDSHVTKTIMRRVLGRQVYAYNAVTSSVSVQGQQAVYGARIFTRNDLNNIAIKANDGVNFPDNGIKLFLEYGKMKVVFKNQSNLVGRVSIYDIDHTKTGPGTGYDEPVEAWTKGFTDMGLTNQHLQVGNTPFGSAEFRQLYRVKKVTTLHMEPGQQHEHTIYVKLNQVCDSTRWSNWTADSIGWLTRSVMLVWHGSLGHESTAATSVSYMPMRLDVAVHREMKYGYLEKKQPAYAYTNVLPTVVNFDFMGENQDVDLDALDA